MRNTALIQKVHVVLEVVPRSRRTLPHRSEQCHFDESKRKTFLCSFAGKDIRSILYDLELLAERNPIIGGHLDGNVPRAEYTYRGSQGIGITRNSSVAVSMKKCI